MSHRKPDTIEMFPDLTPEAKVPPATGDNRLLPVDERIWRYVRDRGAVVDRDAGPCVGGATPFEIDTALELVGRSTSTARVRMLVLANRLRDSGRRRLTTGRHTARVYEAVIPKLSL